jgi:sialidase-1
VLVDSPLNAGLAGAWHFDETAGTVAHDSSGAGNDATIAGGIPWKPGRVSGALDLSVPGIRATVRDPMGRLDVATGDFSLSVWINTRQVPRPGQWPDVMIKVANPDTAQATGYELVFSPDGPLYFQLWAGSSTPIDIQASGINDGRWHHVLCREAGGMLSLHVDGRTVLVKSHPRVRVSSGVPLRLGGSRFNAGGNFDGLVDELRIYARALTDAEITALAGGAAP